MTRSGRQPVPQAKPQRRYPLEPLARLTGRTPEQLVSAKRVNTDGRRTWLTRGLLEENADELAVTYGWHPHEVWPEMLDHAIEDLDHPDAEYWTLTAAERQKIRDRASTRAAYYAKQGRPMPPTPEEAAAERRRQRRRERYVANRERDIEYQRRYRKEAAATLAAKQKRHYAENRDAILERQRAYDRAKAAERRQESA